MTKLFMLILAVSTLTAGCADRDPASAPASHSSNSVAADEGAFYYHQNDKIFLNADPTRIVIQGDDPYAVQTSELLRGFGISIRSSKVLLQQPRHQVIHLSGNTSNVHRAVETLRRNPNISFASTAYRTARGGISFLFVNQLDVEFKAGVSRTDIDAFNRKIGAKVLSPPVPDSGFMAWRLELLPGRDPLLAAQEGSLDSRVEWIDINKIPDNVAQHVPIDPYYSQQFHLRNSAFLNNVRVDLNVEAAWDLTRGNGLVEITIIDDGVDILHSNSGGGFSGDMHTGQWNASGIDYVSAPGEGDAFNPCCNDLHGTALAGIAMASQDNGVGGSGVAPNVRLNSVRVMRRTGGQPGFFAASTSQVAAGINYAWNQMGSHIINMSLGYPINSAMTSAISDAATFGRGGLGTVVVAAAGNGNSRNLGPPSPVAYPASLTATTSLISVSAIDKNGVIAWYAPRNVGLIDVVVVSGSDLAACAPNLLITTDRYGAPGCNNGPSGDINYMQSASGTSSAAPQVAGVAALMLSYNPSLTAAQVKANLRNTAVPWGDEQDFGAGKVDAFRAVRGY